MVYRPAASNLLHRWWSMNAAENTESELHKDHYINYEAHCKVHPLHSRVEVSLLGPGADTKPDSTSVVGVSGSKEILEAIGVFSESGHNSVVQARVVGLPLAGAVSTPSNAEFQQLKDAAFTGSLRSQRATERLKARNPARIGNLPAKRVPKHKPLLKKKRVRPRIGPKRSLGALEAAIHEPAWASSVINNTVTASYPRLLLGEVENEGWAAHHSAGASGRTVRVVKDMLRLGVEPLNKAPYTSAMASFPKLFMMADSLHDWTAWLQFFAAARPLASGEPRGHSSTVPTPPPSLPSALPYEHVHICLGNAMWPLHPGPEGLEDTAGKLVQWIEWYRLNGVNSVHITLRRVMVDAVFPGFSEWLHTLGKPQPQCSDIMDRYGVPSWHESGSIPRGADFLRNVYLHYMCRDPLDVSFAFWEVPDAIIATAHEGDQFAVLQNCATLAWEYSTYTTQLDMDEFMHFTGSDSFRSIGRNLKREQKDYLRLHWRNLYRPKAAQYNLKSVLCGEHPVGSDVPTSLVSESSASSCGLPSSLLAQAQSIRVKEPLYTAVAIGKDLGKLGGKWITVTHFAAYHSLHRVVASKRDPRILNKQSKKSRTATKGPFQTPTHWISYENSPTCVLHYRDVTRDMYIENDEPQPLEVAGIVDRAALSTPYVDIYRRIWASILQLV